MGFGRLKGVSTQLALLILFEIIQLSQHVCSNAISTFYIPKHSMYME